MSTTTDHVQLPPGPGRWWPPELLDERILEELPELNRRIFSADLAIYVGLA